MYQRILVPIDGSDTAKLGLEESVRLAKSTGGRLRLIHVVDDLSLALAMDAYSGHAGDWLNELRMDGARILQEAADVALKAGVMVDTKLKEEFKGAVYEIVLAEAQGWRADLIVLGTHGRRGFGRVVLGSSAESILRHSPIPVLLVRSPQSLSA
ncbi:universal stress protein [Diaphorobacter sp. HDW4A]|uniref:universal stress protein n=1 Tax=Diaphorobacter sp. HDW4A TaxID=2714924 RepID=UPI00140C5F24|nr:universal stress protein [Diaphorobacter sp. HDW4A]QIL80839.1 universal stress protein [Diaphorobacter sp. HDW4A]